ncbi:MAG TPA: hypothetical protein VIG66_00525 [Noviherbaspirillum sp.]
MQIETVGKYQLHLIAHEVGDTRWDPFLAVMRFDEDAQDFVCAMEKRHVGHPCASYEEAIEVARQAGNRFIASGKPVGTAAA